MVLSPDTIIEPVKEEINIIDNFVYEEPPIIELVYVTIATKPSSKVQEHHEYQHKYVLRSH